MSTAVHTPSRSCYQAGCRAADCVRESFLYSKQLDLDHARGHYRKTDATQARVHIERLQAAGWTNRKIAQVAHIPRSVVSAIANGQREAFSRSALAILNIPIGPPPGPPRVDGTGSMRRIQALMSLGHTCRVIGQHVGMSSDKLERIANGRYPTVTPATAEEIARAYRCLITLPGVSWRARKHAAGKGWHGPLAWDAIDDPEAKPETGRRPAPSSGTRRKVYADPQRVAELTRAGHSTAQIALQLGCHVRSVTRARGRVTTNELREVA